ncbi:hypothetical protein BDV35DRAFT_40337 [Aspergillus flavus]|uniref:Uncharacterized protein n=1 Tax=Aspergillus flavus TaxID=5059 RepID=A0A5N6GLV0_ASPFL|nr:hypothetical protein BDV35DRAFT_40337 [Aspergillus flavus]
MTYFDSTYLAAMSILMAAVECDTYCALNNHSLVISFRVDRALIDSMIIIQRQSDHACEGRKNNVQLSPKDTTVQAHVPTHRTVPTMSRLPRGSVISVFVRSTPLCLLTLAFGECYQTSEFRV